MVSLPNFSRAFRINWDFFAAIILKGTKLRFKKRPFLKINFQISNLLHFVGADTLSVKPPFEQIIFHFVASWYSVYHPTLKINLSHALVRFNLSICSIFPFTCTTLMSQWWCYSQLWCWYSPWCCAGPYVW